MIYVFLASGFEEIEAIAIIDVLRRAGIEVKSVGVGGESILGAHKISIKADILLDDVSVDLADGVVLPGGMPGTKNLLDSLKVQEIIKEAHSKGKLIGAICAAPLVLGELCILKSKKACCYPGFENKLVGADISNERVCRDSNIITSKGPGTAIEFALELASYLCGEDKKNELEEEMQCAL